MMMMMMMMEPSQWEYISEGGKHALFGFHPKDKEQQNENMFHGKLLRISKNDVRQSYKMMKQYEKQQPEQQNYDSKDDDDSSASSFYIRNIVQPYFHEFFDLPQTINLEWSFLYDLAKRTLQLQQEQSSTASRRRRRRRRIPMSRKKDWIIMDDDVIDDSSSWSTIRLPEATLIMDYRTITLSVPSISCINVEIKPKAGYLSISPLVDPLHRIKYTTCRFQLLQTLHETGQWSKGWTNTRNNWKKSEYNPLDLFKDCNNADSTIPNEPVRCAISKLLENPQNNLRIWFKNTMMIGYNDDDDDDDDSNGSDKESKILNELLPGWETTITDIASSSNYDSSHRTTKSQATYSPQQILNEELENILYGVLVSDAAKRLLGLIQDWQKLDIVDVEGAGLIHERLKQLCDGSYKKARSQIDDIQLNDLKKSCHADVTSSRTLLPLLELSPFDCDNLSEESSMMLIEFCQAVYDFKNTLEHVHPDLPDANVMNTKREEFLVMVKKLPVDACIFLLRNWILSLAMCDVSIYITLGLLNDDKDEERDCQTMSITLRNGSTRNFMYSLHLIDCDQKPAKKLEGRLEKEAVFQFFSTSNITD
jgi:inositol-pentakisphosphate 2-kinase